jgi:hypothetical protein
MGLGQPGTRQQGIGRRGVLTGASGLLAAPAIVRAQGQNGVALVIGNSKYQWEASLPNVRRDVPDVARRFQALGLKVEVLENLGREALMAALEKFKTAARGANLAAFYFAGHGVSWEKQTYIVPVDADLGDPKMVLNLIPLPSIFAATSEAASRLLVFDSCRNNPADGWRQREARTLARSDAGDMISARMSRPNSIVLLSTAPGGVALDGAAGENSPFAAAFLRQLDGGSIDLQALPANVRRDLLIATECRQMAWDQNTFVAPFILKGPGTQRSIPAPDGLIELTGAYAFAKQSGLVLPPGLIALRSSTASKQGQQIGTYKHLARQNVGQWQSQGQFSNYTLEPCILAVLSITNDNTAHVVSSIKEYRAKHGTRWLFVSSSISKDRLSFLAVDEASRLEYEWLNANSGKYRTHFSNGPAAAWSEPFTRLDG